MRDPIARDPADAQVHRRLETIVDLPDLSAGMSFEEVIRALEDAVDPPLQIQPNWRDLREAAGIEPTTPAGIKPLTSIKLSKALEILLASVSSESTKVGYVVDEGVIVIATANALPKKMMTRVYHIADLLGDPDDHGGLSRVMQAHNLVQFIQKRVDSESWYDLDIEGEGTITPYPMQEPKKLAAYNTFKAHRAILRLLGKVRAGDEHVPTEVPQLMTIRGRCIDSEERPLSDARVLLFSTDNTSAPLIESKTNFRGQFKLGPVASLIEEDYGRRRYLILVPADGHGPAWKTINRYEQTVSYIALKTYNSAAVSGTIVTENSEPVAGAQVWVRGIIPPEATEDPQSRGNDLFTPAPLASWSSTTDGNGSFRIAGVAAGARIQLSVSHPNFAWSIVHVKPGKNPVIEVRPAATVTGRVLHGETGEPAVGVKVQAQGIDRVSVPGGSMKGWAETLTDNQGRYKLKSLHGSRYNIWAQAEDLTVVAMNSFKVDAGQTRQAPDLLLIEGGFITGRVIDEATGEPIKPGLGSDVAIYGPSRPKSGAAVEVSHLREDGSFRIRVAPGRNYIYLRAGDNWRRQQSQVTPSSRWSNCRSRVQDSKVLTGRIGGCEETRPQEQVYNPENHRRRQGRA